jgi:signal recognition particle subunit SRP54
MFEALAKSFQELFRKLAGRPILTEKNIQDGLRDVRLALLQADVNYKVVKDFINRVSKKAVGRDVIKGVNPAQQFIKVVYDELVELMGPTDHTLPFNTDALTLFMLVGLQGSGKTTTCVKLAKYIKKNFNKTSLLVASDVQRPAAVEQLITVAKQHGFETFSEKASRPLKICQMAVSYAKEKHYDTVILDTQGRLHINQELMNELKEMKEKLKPQQIYLVTDAMTGQDAVNSASEFNRVLDLDGVILTKLDSDTRGGAALSIKAVTGKSIKFAGIGEKIEQLEEFHPDRMASRILGMGDVVSLVEKAQQTIEVEEAKKLEQKLKEGDINFQDILDQFQRVKKMGPLRELVKLIPGLGSAVDELDENQMKQMEAIILSMTPQERKNPELLSNMSRKMRIAKGSGTSVAEVNTIVKQLDLARKMMRELKKGKGDFFKFLKKMGIRDLNL